MDRALVVFGLGYSGRAIAQAAHRAGWRVVAVSRGVGDGSSLAVVPFADPTPALARATHVVLTAAPGEAGDPVLAAHETALARAPHLAWIGYLSTTGVYGDRGGAWVSETDAPAPAKPHSLARRAAEAAWEAFAARRAVALDLIRLGGIYGPGRSPFADLRAGRARRVIKPGHVFNRIHVADIAGLVLAAAAVPAAPGRARVLHGADDEPAPQADVVAEAARLLGVPAPPEVPFEDAACTMGPMALAFWSENRRVANALTKAATGWSPRFPSYREGLAAILAEEGGEGAGQQHEIGRA
ncbi:MAG: SDR family NAD(P)-dependent oxidoreductase [Elioraea sp.]|nr:SDR family NAD(P)-dependent oxidoreductase [Elioraea sp.]